MNLDSLESQIEAITPFIRPATSSVFTPMATELIGRDEAIFIAGQRFGDGFREYGSGLFEMSDEELDINLKQEIADAIIYRAEQLRREA